MSAKLFVLDGPACVGKTSFARRLLADESLKLRFCPRITSRPPEKDDTEYSYVSPDAFETLVRNGDFASYRVYLGGVSYGVPKKPINEILSRDEHALAIVDLGTGEQIKESWPDAVTIFLISPAEEIEQRLNSKFNNPTKVAEKLQNAINSYSFAPYYDYVVPNRQGRADLAYTRIRDIISSYQ